MLERSGLRLTGADLVVWSDVPLGAGLSSSAALEVSVAHALLAAAGLPFEPVAAARIAQRAENEFVGMRCGIMDQYIAACGVAGNALLIDCRSLESRPVPIAPNLRLRHRQLQRPPPARRRRIQRPARRLRRGRAAAEAPSRTDRGAARRDARRSRAPSPRSARPRLSPLPPHRHRERARARSRARAEGRRLRSLRRRDERFAGLDARRLRDHLPGDRLPRRLSRKGSRASTARA